MMGFLIVRGLDAAGALEVWKIKAVDILQWSRVLYSAKKDLMIRHLEQKAIRRRVSHPRFQQSQVGKSAAAHVRIRCK